MVMKKIPALGNLDFVPIPGGDDPNFIFGVVRRQIKDGPIQTVPASVLRRLCPGRKADVAESARCHCSSPFLTQLL